MLRRIGRALRSLRWRLTLTYVALLGLLLAGLGAYQYVALRQSLIANRIATLQDDFTTARTLLSRSAPTSSVRTGQLCTAAPRPAARLVATTVAQVSGHTVGVVVYDRSHAVAGAAPARAALPRLDSTLVSQALTGRRSDPQVISQSSGDQLAVGFPIATGRGVCGAAQLSIPMAPMDRVLADDIVFLSAGTAGALAAALVAGLLLTSRALGPLRRLTSTAEQLAAGDLNARSRLMPRDDEVGTLTRSFDHMADRIQAAFTSQQESEAHVRRFIADASHELRTPVTALKGYIDVLRRGAARDPGALDGALEAMGDEADRMRLLVLDLLTLARIDARRGVATESFDLNAELERLLDDGRPDMPSALERRLTPHPLMVRADRAALATIVRNVAGNANKYAPGAKQLWVTTADGSRARVDAHDNGPGIAAADLPHIFERFYRGEKMRGRADGGSGLGLAIVQGLAQAQGGDVAVTSAEGAGTTVTLWLPLADAASTPAT
jgi:two-component system, OmpR family, sensor kinase